MIEHSMNWLPFVLSDGSLFYVVLQSESDHSENRLNTNLENENKCKRQYTDYPTENHVENRTIECMNCSNSRSHPHIPHIQGRYRSKSNCHCDTGNDFIVQRDIHLQTNDNGLQIRKDDNLNNTYNCAHSETSSVSNDSTCSSSSSNSVKGSKRVRFSHRIRRVKHGLSFWAK